MCSCLKSGIVSARGLWFNFKSGERCHCLKSVTVRTKGTERERKKKNEMIITFTTSNEDVLDVYL